jgi:hypothetical protein
MSFSYVTCPAFTLQVGNRCSRDMGIIEHGCSMDVSPVDM